MTDKELVGKAARPHVGRAGKLLAQGRQDLAPLSARGPFQEAGSPALRYSFRIIPPLPCGIVCTKQRKLELVDTQEKLTKGQNPVSWKAYGRHAISASNTIREEKREKPFISLEKLVSTC